MAVQQFLRFQCHEFDAHFHMVRDGLKPYYGLDRTRKDHDWKNAGKPTATFEIDGETWHACLDFDDQPIVPWEDPSYRLNSAYLYRIYFVCDDGTYDDERADRSKRVKGGTVTIRPRWPNMKKRDDETGQVSKVQGYMDLGVPYLDAQVQASNVDFERYPDLLAEAAAAFDVPRRYFDEFAESSNIKDAAVYARVVSDESGPIYAPDGPLARIHSLLEGDRSGYRKHVEDNRDRPGDMVTTVVDGDRARKLIRGHRLGKEIKHYYMKDPDTYDEDEFGSHPKLEVAFQTSVTDETVYWDREDDELDRQDLRRELEETLANVLEWAGFDVTGGDRYFEDEYFDPDDREQRTLKLVDCPLPEIESEQEAAVMRLWGDMNPSGRAVTETLLSDGGEVSPADAAEKTGYCYDTVLRVVDRLEGVVRHTYGQLEIESDYVAEALIKRVRSSAEQFTREIGSATMQVAEDAQGIASDALDAWRTRYDAGIEQNREDCRLLLKPRLSATDRDHAREIAREAYRAVCERFSSHHGVHIKIELADGSIVRWRDLSQVFLSAPDHDEIGKSRRRRCSRRQQLDEERSELEQFRADRRRATR
ncbi:hypothetical protein [Halovivax limisalsi]|uniref:DUF7845 domain-containing protein n=1 Tax=Halovivax limisalsi TaxID=1453760 RepID=UPI001FFD24DE|nr:hypothetical protein [Halovivax limisalsi]